MFQEKIRYVVDTRTTLIFYAHSFSVNSVFNLQCIKNYEVLLYACMYTSSIEVKSCMDLI